jgi:carbonic anhydrase
MSATDELLGDNAGYARRYGAPRSFWPPKGVAVIAWMDARMDVYAILGLRPGEAHVIRNAGAVFTDDEIGSLSTTEFL